MNFNKIALITGLVVGGITFSGNAKAITITNIKVTDISPKNGSMFFVNPGDTISILVAGRGSFTYEDAQLNQLYTIAQSITITNSDQDISASNTNIFPTVPTGTLIDQLSFTPSLGIGTYTAKYTISVGNQSDNKSTSFEIKPVPWETDALSVIGTTLLFGLGVWTKRKSVKPLDKE
jgi:hypothetical protein